MKFIGFLLHILPEKIVYAHCDIPCGIYDPYQAQMAVHTVIRMTQLIQELQTSSENPSFEERKKVIHQIARLTRVKEEHAELVKHEIRILWGDYFKEEHLKEYPHLHELVFNILKLASKARQAIDMTVSQELLVKVQELAEIFYKTKGAVPVRVKSFYPTEGELVSHQ